MLQIRLLGQFDIRLNGKRVLISSRNAQSLLAYLALTAGTSHRREKLAGIFWPEVTEERSRTYLRHELWRIRKAISTQQSSVDNYLLAEEFTIGFNRNSDFWLDVVQIERPDTDLQSLTSNLSLYQGELLPGFYEDWIALERERIQSIFDIKMEQLLAQLIDTKRWMAVQEQAERWLALGHTLEPAYRALMLAHGVRGDMAKVSSVYQRCMNELNEQFGLEPSAETRALYDGLLKGAHIPAQQTAHPSGTITFLFTDIEESTKLLDQLGNQYAEVLAEHHKILRAAIQKWNGHEVDTQGDAFFVTFSRALDAVQCSAEAQHAIASHPWAHGQPLRVRMGLHTGEPLIASTGYVGMDVHRAARIGDVGHGGQILLSQTTRELVLHDLPAGLAIRDLGEHRLKDLKFPTPIFQLIVAGLAHNFPPLRTKFAGTEAPTPGETPFKGLEYFDETDSDLFFGRELLTAKLVNRLRETEFLSVIVGASGSGKSSLVRAGVIPAIKRGRTLRDGTKPPEGSMGWQVHVITPTAHPLEALAIELTRESESVTAAATLVDDLIQDPRSLALFLERRNPKQHTLLVLDQFEELFTLCRDEFEREAFIDNLLTTIAPSLSAEEKKGEGKVTLILTLRADFYAHLAQYPELRDAVAKQQEYIGPMTTEELRRAIEEPAKRGHWEFEPGLVDLILRDVGEEPGALPLLSHALLETWQRRAGHTLTLKGYADAGGVQGAIAHTAESVYQKLSTAEQAIARNIFLRLTELGEGTEDTRRRTSFEELISQAQDADEVRAVLNLLADARLITLGEKTAEVAHEALIREWPTLREWLNQDRESLQLHRHLTESAQEWELLERDPGSLYRGARLVQAREWAVVHPTALNAREKAFLAASNAFEQSEIEERRAHQRRELEAAQKLADTERSRAEDQAHSANRLRIRNRVITAVGSIALILAILAGTFGLQSNRNAVQAQGNFKHAEAQRLAAEANKLSLSRGSPELVALLSIRSMNTQYTPQGDAALVASSRLDYPRQLLIGHSAPIFSVAFSPDGKYILTGSLDKTARLWSVQTGKEVRQFIGHTEIIYSAIFSPDGKYVVTSSWDETARLWDVKTGKEIRRFIGHTDNLGNVYYSPNGKLILTSSIDGTVRLWDPTTGQEFHKLEYAWGIFSPDSKYILAGDTNGTAHLWDIQTQQEVPEFVAQTGKGNSVALSPDGKFFLIGGQDGPVRLFDLRTGKELRSFIGHNTQVTSMAFSPDGKFVFTASLDSTVRMWDAQTAQELQRFTCPNAVHGMAISPDGNVLLTGSEDGTARVWSIAPKSELPTFMNRSGINAVAFSSDSKFVLTGDSLGVAKLWDAVSGQEIREFIGHADLINYGAAFSPNEKYIVTASWDKTVRLWDVQTGKEVRQFLGHTYGVNSVVFSKNGKYILTAASDQTARLWEVETGREVRKFRGNDAFWRAAFSPDEKSIIAAGDSGRAELWETTTGRLLRLFTGTTSGINGAAFSPDGRYMVTAHNDKLARLWDVQTGKEIRQFIGHTEGLYSAIFSPDGRYVATASLDDTARLWDTQTGQELRRFIGHTGDIENLVFSPDGKYLLTGSDDGTALLWDVDYHDTVRYLCSVLLRDFTVDERTEYGIADNTPTCPKQ